MARIRFKPYWDELKKLQVVQVIEGKEVIPVANIKNYLMYLRERGIHYSISQTLLQKEYLSKEEYDSIQVSELLMASYTEGENDTISSEILKRIARPTKK